MSIDNLNQSGATVPLPDDLQAQIENAKNSVSLMQAEYSRLQKLVLNEKDKLERIHDEKTNVDAKVFTVTNQIEELVKSLAQKQFDKIALDTEFENAKSNLAEATDKANTMTAVHTKKSAELDERETSIVAREENLNERLINLIQKETNHESKVDKLKRAME